MMTLSDLREYVWAQTQTVDTELSTASIDDFLQEAFNRTIAMENQWPFYEKTWGITVPTGEWTAPIPGDVNQPAITGIFDPTANGWWMDWMPHNTAQESYAGSGTAITSRYINYSIWAQTFHFWPKITFGEDRVLQVTGFRKPTDWITEGPAGSPDCDERLHRPLAHYAVALAYAQQEDEQLESSYMKRWEIDVAAARGAIMEPSQDRPLIMGPIHWQTRAQPHRVAIVNTQGL